MKVYLVNGWDKYYPEPDNTLKVFRNREDARDFLLTLMAQGESWERLDRYNIFEKEVEE